MAKDFSLYQDILLDQSVVKSNDVFVAKISPNGLATVDRVGFLYIANENIIGHAFGNKDFSPFVLKLNMNSRIKMKDLNRNIRSLKNCMNNADEAVVNVYTPTEKYTSGNEPVVVLIASKDPNLLWNKIENNQSILGAKNNSALKFLYEKEWPEFEQSILVPA